MKPEELFGKLSAPFPPDQVHWRVGSTNREKTKGMALAYLDARDVMDRLDAVIGPAYWQCRYPHANVKTVCEIGLALPTLTQPGQLEWVWKADGAGDTDHEAEKGALSDAFKRAAVRWGIGRYLYDLGNVWVEIEPFGKSYKIKDSEHAKLRRRLPNAPAEKPAPVSPVEVQKVDDFGLPEIKEKPSDRAIANTLIAALKKSTTEAELDAWGRETKNKAALKGLPDDLQGEVIHAGSVHRSALQFQASRAA